MNHEHTPFWGYFTPAEQQALRAIPPHDLTPEIRLLTAGQIQFLEDEQRAPTHAHDLQAENLKVFGRAAVCIGFMERTRLKVQGLTSRYDSVIKAAYNLARHQMGVNTYLLEAASTSEEPTE
jgi:hypothetical protein